MQIYLKSGQKLNGILKKIVIKILINMQQHLHKLFLQRYLPSNPEPHFSATLFHLHLKRMQTCALIINHFVLSDGQTHISLFVEFEISLCGVD